ncbi:hypothetical protein L1049_018489 [Liquidambar formosana]|uniref:Alcohol dehydrogenase-like C-terminal domain-containing protein n=1 Tax=Liquidambar formosana TaxID=63359 RepID=A0AAP0RA55_LIQFO
MHLQVQHLLAKLNEILAQEVVNEVGLWKKKLTDQSLQLFEFLPEAIQEQLMLERDPHGNVQVAKIETKKMLIQMVETELEKRKQEGAYKGQFKGQSHFFGLAILALLQKVQFVSAGKFKPVIKKAMVELEGAPFKKFASMRDEWALKNQYISPCSCWSLTRPKLIFHLNRIMMPKQSKKAIAEMTSGGVDQSVECTGNINAMSSAFECVHDGWGVVVLVGVPNKDDAFKTHTVNLLNERTLKGTFFGNYKPHTDLPSVMEKF